MTEEQWQDLGNVELYLMTLSYIASVVLLCIIRPHDKYEWSVFLKLGTMALILINASLLLLLGWGGLLPVRVLLFGIGTLCSWFFTTMSWQVWRKRRRGD